MTENPVRFLVIAFWILALVIALCIDSHVAQWTYDAFPHFKGSTLASVLKLPGYYPFTLVLAGLVLIFHRKTWRAALPIVLGGPLAGLAYLILKWIVGRKRPEFHAPYDFHPLAHGLKGLIHAEAGLSFPSGHTALAFATATCLSAALPRQSLLFFLFAAIVASERMAEYAHYPSDVLAGAIVGVLCGGLAVRIVGAIPQNPSDSGESFVRFF